MQAHLHREHRGAETPKNLVQGRFSSPSGGRRQRPATFSGEKRHSTGIAAQEPPAQGPSAAPSRPPPELGPKENAHLAGGRGQTTFLKGESLSSLREVEHRGQFKLPATATGFRFDRFRPLV